MKVIKRRPYFDPHSVPKGINKINLFERILGDILLDMLGLQEEYNKNTYLMIVKHERCATKPLRQTHVY